MKVKLGFAVASHLDSEIMIMDEVLAVGDVNFQNKCINRMKEVAEKEGRTILYVSHNMATVKSLCDRCIVLSHGKVIFDGAPDEAIALYVQEEVNDDVFYDVSSDEREDKCVLRHLVQNIELLDTESNIYKYGDKIKFRMNWNSDNDNDRVLFKAIMFTVDKTGIGVVYGGELEDKKGHNSAEFEFDTSCLFPGKYYIDIKLYNEDKAGNVVYYDQCKGFSFSLIHNENTLHLKHWFSDWGNTVYPDFVNLHIENS